MKTASMLSLATALLLGATAAFAAGDAEKGEQVYKKCKACHAIGEGATNRVGPPLNDIVGAKAAAKEGYRYSKSMREKAEAGLVWTEENLDAYLKNPKEVVPKGKMAFPGLKQDDDRANVISYLKKFSKPQ